MAHSHGQSRKPELKVAGAMAWTLVPACEVSIFIFPGGLIQILSSIFMFILLIFIFILLYIYGSINCIHIYMHKVAFHALSFLHALLYSVRELESCSLEVQLNKDLCIMLSAFACVKHNRKIMPASSIYRQM